MDLASFGHQMDEEERIRMAESGVDSEDYKLFLEVCMKCNVTSEVLFFLPVTFVLYICIYIFQYFYSTYIKTPLYATYSLSYREDVTLFSFKNFLNVIDIKTLGIVILHQEPSKCVCNDSFLCLATIRKHG